MSFKEIIKQKKNLKPMAPKDKSFEFICNVINKAMSFNVDDRYQSAVELLNVLNPVADNHTAIKKKTPIVQQETFVEFATKKHIDNNIEDSDCCNDIGPYDFDDKKNPDPTYKPFRSKRPVFDYDRDKVSVDIDVLIDKATEKMQKEQYKEAIEILKDRNEESARILRAKAYIHMGNATSKAIDELEGIEHPCAYFLKAKMLKENGDTNSLFMSYLRKSSSYDYPPAMLAYGMYSKNYDYVIKAAQIYSKAFRVVAKLVQKSLVSMDDYASLNNKKRFANIHQLDKVFLKYYDNNFAPYE